MAIIVRKTGGDFVPAPPGTWAAVCVDVVDLGELTNTWRGDKQHKVRIVWQISEKMPDGKPYLIQRMYTLSLHEKSNLRKDLASWRGRDFNEKELQGFDLENVIGHGCLLSIVHQVSMNDGQTYANVVAVLHLPAGYEPPRPDGYVRTIHRPQEQQQPPKPQGMQSGPRQFPQPQQQPWQPAAPPQPLPAPQPGATLTAMTPEERQAFTHPQEINDDDVPF